MSNVLSKNVVRTKYMATDLQYQYFLTSFNHRTSISTSFVLRCTTHNIQHSQLHRLHDQVLFPYTRPMIFQTCWNMDYIICMCLYAMVQRMISGVSTLPFQDVMGSCATSESVHVVNLSSWSKFYWSAPNNLPWYSLMIFQTCRIVSDIIYRCLYAMVQRIISGGSTAPVRTRGRCTLCPKTVTSLISLRAWGFIDLLQTIFHDTVSWSFRRVELWVI